MKSAPLGAAWVCRVTAPPRWGLGRLVEGHRKLNLERQTQPLVSRMHSGTRGAQDRILRRLEDKRIGAPLVYKEPYTRCPPLLPDGFERRTALLSGQRPASYQPRATPWVHGPVLLLQAKGLPHKVGPVGSNNVIQSHPLEEEHHRTHTFQEAHRNLLNKYHVEFYERYVGD